MCNSRLRSELIDSLDYLIPPVKKLPRALYKDLLYDDARLTDQSLLRNCHGTIFAKRYPFLSRKSESEVQSCSSLILKKTTKQFIRDQYSILNLNKCNPKPDLCIQNKIRQRIFRTKEEKPIIKVTVIPKVKETQTSKVFNNCFKYTKKVQTTVSNQDNSIKNQNVYLLIKGKKREKVHDLKASESAKLSRNINHKYGDISIEQITESRQIINSLNMDKSKRKENKNKKTLKTHIFDEHESPKDRQNDKFLNAKDHKSRLSIVGQLDMTQDDRYVLKCSGAVNNKPIETNCIDDANPMSLNKNNNFHQSPYQYRPTACDVYNCEALRQNREHYGDIQTDIGNPYYLRSATPNNRVASQSTQVNFNFTNHPATKKFRNQVAQCNCNPSTADPLDTEAGDKLLKKCQSPLVIISVYPRQDKGTDENDTVRIIQRQTSPERKEVSNNVRNYITQRKFKQISSGPMNANKKMETKLPRSRSPSPTTKIGSKKNIEYKTDTRGRNKTVIKNGGPSITRSNKSYIINNLQEHTSCNCNNTKFLQIEDFDRQNKINNSKDTEEVKKALVNSFLRNVNVIEKDNRNSMKFRPTEDASKVTININGQNDDYDVLLEHSYHDAAVSVKKTKKVPPENLSSDEEVNTKSLENFLLVSHEKMKKKENQQSERTRQPDVKIKPTYSRLNIRDSIEICQRQGEHSNYRPKSLLKHEKNDFTEAILNSDSYAPVKHYRGDDCSLSDPNERDREIRELLGVMRCHRLQDKENTDDQQTKEKGCCCNRKCPTSLMRGTSISKIFTSKCLKRKTKRADIQHETTQTGYNTVVREANEKTESSQKDIRKFNISKLTLKSKITEKSEDKCVSEYSDLVKSEEETPETTETTEDSSKDHINHRTYKQDNAIQVKTVSHREKNIFKATTEKDRNEKLNNPGTVQMHDEIMSQHLILNRNIQIFLQVEQFNKEKPVVLTREQYDKVKKIIECTISKKLSIQKRKRCNLKHYNVVSIGEIKVKPLSPPLRFDHAIQTDQTEINKSAQFIKDTFKVKNTRAHNTKHIINKKMYNHMETDVMTLERVNIEQVHPRQTVSSMEIRYANIEYKKQAIISSSSTRFENNNINWRHTSNVGRNSSSIQTIFKGHKRSATPNLGTSAYSLNSNITDFSNKSHKQPKCAGDFKPKKPFLQRLISCLVMRSTQTSYIKNEAQRRNLPTVDSSMDSYHLSTSLGAVEMSSSLFDTSASFYSNHTIMPVSKIKRGFFSSVRGFLTSRRS